MPVDLTFNRPKLATVIATALNFTMTAAERPGTPAAPASGNTGILDVFFKLDGDPTVGADVQTAGKLTVTPSFVDRKFILSWTFAPMDGSGVLASGADQGLKSGTWDCVGDLDAWQTAAGNARVNS